MSESIINMNMKHHAHAHAHADRKQMSGAVGPHLSEHVSELQVVLKESS